MPLHVAGVLLSFVKWDVDALLERYLADRGALFREAGVSEAASFKPRVRSGSVALHAAGNEVECEACMDDVAIGATFSLGCGHLFCLSCWQGYLETAEQEGKGGGRDW